MRSPNVPRLLLSAISVLPGALLADTLTWDGNSGTSSASNINWGLSGNWAEAPPSPVVFNSSTDLVFNAAGAGKLTNQIGDSDRTIRSITFNGNAGFNVLIAFKGSSVAATNLIMNGGGAGASITCDAGSSEPHVVGNSGGSLVLADNLLLTNNSAATLTIGRPISQSGVARNLTKAGPGIVILSNSGSYTGTTAVNGGLLVVDGNHSAATGAITVGGSAASGSPRLGGTGTIGGDTTISAAAGGAAGMLAPGGFLTSGTLAFNNRNLTLQTGARLSFRLGTISDAVSGVATLNLNGQQWGDFAFSENAGFGPGSYTLIEAAQVGGSLGATVSGSLGNNRVGTLSVTGAGDLVLTVTGPPVITEFSASPAYVSSGSSSTLSWSTSGATSLTLTQSGGATDVTGISSGGAGTQVVTPSATTNYLLSASNSHGSSSATVKVTLLPAGFQRPNFLFIPIDDLKPICGHMSEEPGNFLQQIYPDPVLRAQKRALLTPNIDRLADEGVSFMRAYTPSTVCSPARVAIMTGIQPHVSGHISHANNMDTTFFRDMNAMLSNATTLPEFLKANDYYTAGTGKIFHWNTGVRDKADSPRSWSQWAAIYKTTGLTASQWSPQAGSLNWGIYAPGLTDMYDYERADLIAKLISNGTATEFDNEFKTNVTLTRPSNKPFFMACGIYHPHLVFSAPSDLLNHFPLNEITFTRAMFDEALDDLLDLPPTGLAFTPATINNGDATIASSSNLLTTLQHGLSIDPVNGDLTALRDMIRHYLAAVAVADRCVGRMLDALDNSPYADNTVVVLWSDHGYHLGEKARDAKSSLWEPSTNTVFIIRAPGMAAGQRCYQTVGTIDIYKTICSLAGLTPPAAVAGNDLTPLLANPQLPWNSPALSTIRQTNHNALRNERYRYIRYNSNPDDAELYDMVADPDEVNNLANDEAYASVRAEMDARLSSVLASNSAVPSVPTFDLWRTVKFSAADAANEAASGALADPDDDGLVNLLEFTFGTEPTSASSRLSLEASVVEEYGRITYRESKAASGALIVAEASGDMETWSPAGLTEVQRIDQGTHWEVTVRDATPLSGADRRFLRLRVIQQ